MTSLPAERDIYCNRTLNLRSIKVIGYDLDYTLVHYNTLEWERRAYHHTRVRLAERGWPVDDLTFDPDQVIQGLTLDLELGNLLKVTRFGYVIRAVHGTRLLEFDELRRAYAGTFVDLSEPRWRFVNTLFSLSEATLFAQLVDLADKGSIPEVMGYDDLYRTILGALNAAHLEGTLKGEILADPDQVHRARPRRGRHSARPAERREAPHADHQLRLGLCQPDHDPCVRSGVGTRERPGVISSTR